MTRRDLDHGLELGNRSVDILARVQSTRAKDYVREFNEALAPWRREPAVREFVHRTRAELGVVAQQNERDLAQPRRAGPALTRVAVESPPPRSVGAPECPLLHRS
ncbi:hypothetical protein ACFO9E_05180 [Streptomyces maoxianensis]|uniref:Uncharacterized protein n=1 Tax=Streptomyces maoxianensis TaxID=1459942 RepID=A0ABV9FYS2_9ACTN